MEKPTSLTVSGQLEAECMAMAFGKVYTFGPTFRAERSYTPRHAAEFWMIEPEMAFADLADDMDVHTGHAQIRHLLCFGALPRRDGFLWISFMDKGLLARLQGVVDADFGHVTYTEAIAILEQHQEQV